MGGEGEKKEDKRQQKRPGPGGGGRTSSNKRRKLVAAKRNLLDLSNNELLFLLTVDENTTRAEVDELVRELRDMKRFVVVRSKNATGAEGRSFLHHIFSMVNNKFAVCAAEKKGEKVLEKAVEKWQQSTTFDLNGVCVSHPHCGHKTQEEATCYGFEFTTEFFRRLQELPGGVGDALLRELNPLSPGKSGVVTGNARHQQQEQGAGGQKEGQEQQAAMLFFICIGMWASAFTGKTPGGSCSWFLLLSCCCGYYHDDAAIHQGCIWTTTATAPSWVLWRCLRAKVRARLPTRRYFSSHVTVGWS